MTQATPSRMQSQTRARPWTDVERRAWDWNLRQGRPIKSLACASRRQRQTRAGYWHLMPDHGACVGVADGPCACNCHFTWDDDLDRGLVRLVDGRVGLCLRVLKAPDYTMEVLVSGDTKVSVDIGGPVLLDQAGD